ncbi:hypothetical protein PIB30_036503 [Stylosanthes scabra]|uniref:Aminotransferase-like plant mobile domain-containing protein n=1 Tax=Stylosanthes scabra TaxID=79078 RepID=A0ABU6ZAD7_9FABA|nr:hypothetical protein [Stylosanthes scabra]
MALNIDFLYSKDECVCDRWFPHTYQTWHNDWDGRVGHVMAIVRVPDLGPSELYLRWWFIAAKRFLLADATYTDPRTTQMPVEWLDQMMGDEEVPDGGHHRIRHMPKGVVGGRHRRGGEVGEVVLLAVVELTEEG